jgi:hypothetical protein
MHPTRILVHKATTDILSTIVSNFTAFEILLLMVYNAYQHSWKPEPGICVRSDVCQISGILYTKHDY